MDAAFTNMDSLRVIRSMKILRIPPNSNALTDAQISAAVTASSAPMSPDGNTSANKSALRRGVSSPASVAASAASRNGATSDALTFSEMKRNKSRMPIFFSGNGL